MNSFLLENRPNGFRASAVVIRNDCILLMHRIHNGFEYYNLPGGTWEEGETLESTCRRELKEESGLDVEVGNLIYIVDSKKRINFVFSCTATSSDIALGGPELLESSPTNKYLIEWLPIKQLPSINLQPTRSASALQQYLKGEEIKTFFVQED